MRTLKPFWAGLKTVLFCKRETTGAGVMVMPACVINFGIL
jgi:hypothetical protein